MALGSGQGERLGHMAKEAEMYEWCVGGGHPAHVVLCIVRTLLFYSE